MVTIFGKANCPHTKAARAHYEAAGPVEYVDVKASAQDLDRMLAASGGERRVPVIVDADGRVTIGFGGT